MDSKEKSIIVTFQGERRNRGTWKEREFSEASEDFSSLEIFWDNCELVSQGEAIVADSLIMIGGLKIWIEIRFTFSLFCIIAFLQLTTQIN